jgi:mercuric ion binding protein
MPGVTAKRVDSRRATVTVSFDSERTNPAAIAKAITDAGFPATAVTSKNGG